VATDALTLERARDRDPARQARFFSSRVLIYGALLLWAFISLFPIYWTVTTSFKVAVNVTQGHLVPWVDFQPDWKGWRSLGLSPDRIGESSTERDEFLKRFENSILASVGASILAVINGSPPTGSAASSTSSALAQQGHLLLLPLVLILPPVVLAMPFLALTRSWRCSTPRSPILVYTLMVLLIVIGSCGTS
jgi:multiple sugar transport system permease protein